MNTLISEEPVANDTYGVITGAIELHDVGVVHPGQLTELHTEDTA